MATDPNRARIPEVAVSASAAVGGFASLLAWAACCVLPLVLSIAGVSFAGVAVFACGSGPGFFTLDEVSGLLLRELEHEWGVTAVACRALSRAESLALREV